MRKTEITSLVEAAGPTLCVFLLAMSASFSPEPYRAKGCLLSLLSSLGCRVAAGRTRWERQKCLEDLGGLLSCGPPVSPSKNNHTKSLIHFDKLKSKQNIDKMDSVINLVPTTDSVFALRELIVVTFHNRESPHTNDLKKAV